jgi:transposase InsO family protein
MRREPIAAHAVRAGLVDADLDVVFKQGMSPRWRGDRRRCPFYTLLWPSSCDPGEPIVGIVIIGITVQHFLEVLIMPSYDPQSIALFRYQVIASLLALSGPRGVLKQEIKRLAERRHEHPYRGPSQYSYSTIEDWLYCYKRGGLDGLKPAPRSDRGCSRIITDSLAEMIETLAKGRPDLDGRGILAELRCQCPGHKLPSLSSLYRFLRARGLDQRAAPRRQDHRAYAFDLAGDCWQIDVMYGPALAVRQGSRRKTYLIALLDDATRVVPHAQFYFDQHLRCLKDCLKQALLKRGVPRRLYMDNGKIFRSRMILGVCARLGMQLIHSRPYRPQGRAKLERFFGTVRRGFLRRLDIDRVQGLEGLNRLLFAWIEGQYHIEPHRGLNGQAPLDCWLRLSGGLRPLPREVDVEELFLEQTTRTVAKDGTISFDGKRFEVGPTWIGQRLTVRFDPFDLRCVWIEDPRGQAQPVFPVDLSGNRRVRRNLLPEPVCETPVVDLQALPRLADQMEDKSYWEESIEHLEQPHSKEDGHE